jgi:hypothetical protein
MTARLAGFALAASLCLTLYWPGLWTWFYMDDFAWLGLRLSIFTWRDLLDALFAPKAQGTIRPLSERLYFLSLEKLFGLESLPFRVVAFATQLLNLWLILRLVERVTGSRWGGVAAGVIWVVNSALASAMSWTSAYNQILWPCLLLSACHARWTWLETGNPRARRWEWVFFLLGFGALELQVVYPAIAAALTLLYRRERWRDLPPLFAVAAAYAVFNRMIARPAGGSVYKLHWDAEIVATLGTYVRMATGIWRPDLYREAEKEWLAVEWFLGAAMVAAAIWFLRRRDRWAAFGLIWFLAVLAPVLPLKNHISPYYLTVPVLGLAFAAGAAVVRRPWVAAIPVLVYLAASGYWSRRTVDYNCNRAETARVLFEGVREAAEIHPGKAILLTSVSSEQYWSGINDDPFRLVPGLRLYLAPGGDANIERHPELGDPARFVLPGPAAREALDNRQAVVYTPTGGKLRNVTAVWRMLARERWGGELATDVDAGLPLLASQLGAGWYPAEQGFRWASGEASLRLGAPRAARELAVTAYRGDDTTRGPVTLVLSVNGSEAGRWVVEPGVATLEAAAPLPPQVDRSKPVDVRVRIFPVLGRDVTGDRELGLAFGRFTLR